MADFTRIQKNMQCLSVKPDNLQTGHQSMDSGIHCDSLEYPKSQGNTKRAPSSGIYNQEQDVDLLKADLIRASSEMILGDRKMHRSTASLLSDTSGGYTRSKSSCRSSSDSPSENSSSTTTYVADDRVQNPYDDHIYSEISSLSRTPLSFHTKSKRRLSWGESTKPQTRRRAPSDAYASFLDKYPKLTNLDYVPWGEQEVLNILREGRAKSYSGHITVEMMQRLSTLLRRPLARIAREAQRFAAMFRRCTRHDLQSAMKVVLPRPLYDSCVQACMKAVALYNMKSGSLTKASKSQHCGLKFSVGRFHRWLLDTKISCRIQEAAAIFLAACIENLLEEVVLRGLGHLELGSSVFSLEAMEGGIAMNPDLWGLLQQSEHLVCGRISSGSLSLSNAAINQVSLNLGGVEDGSPGTLSSSSGFSSSASMSISSNGSSPEGSLEGKGSSRGATYFEGLETTLLSTCVGSIPELGNLISQVMHHWQSVMAPSSTQRPSLTWGADALHALFHYTKCSQMAPKSQPKLHQGDTKLCRERPYSLQPPLVEWVRTTLAHTEHRCALVVDGDDVTQAARVLLPSSDCPQRMFKPSVQCWRSTQQTSTQCQLQVQQDMAFSMLCIGRSDLLPFALSLLGPEGVNTFNDQGLTPLMCACLHGDEAMVQMLLDAGASVDKAVPSDGHKFPGLIPDTKHWTTLTFASLLSHIGIIQLLLERRACVEGAGSEDNPLCETPLQIAAAAGHCDVVVMLLNYGADPYLTSTTSILSGSQSGHNAFTLAAMHGHRTIFKKLLANPKSKLDEALSLEEMLAEGQDAISVDYECVGQSSTRQTCQNSPSRSHQYYNHIFSSLGDQHRHCSEEENFYMTIDEATLQSINKRNDSFRLHAPEPSSTLSSMSSTSSSASSSSLLSHNISKAQYKVLQEAMYHAAESGHLDIALELRSLGVNWSMHIWSQCLWAAHLLQRKTIIQCLLKDYLATGRHEELNIEFINECFPLMFHIFRNSKNDITGQQLANILSSLYGNQPVPPIPTLRGKTIARIDPFYVNNPEMSDIQFVVEGKVFHGHKILLVNASSHMRSLLEEARKKTSSDVTGAVTKVDIHDIKFKTFEMMMTFLYHGAVDTQGMDTKELLDLLKASHTYKLDSLKRHCEIIISKHLNIDNSAVIYKHSKVYNANELLAYSEGFFLQNLTQLLNQCDGFRKLLYSYKMLNYDLVNGLLATLCQTLEDKLSMQSKTSILV